MSEPKVLHDADFTPTKRFFVEMLTRDIQLEDAILDLLDNCLDGVARSQSKDPETIDYSGHWAKIEFDSTKFSIEDNCGGIPEARIDYAFRMGKPLDAPREELATVGVYGIGMKRSIFKMGENSVITTKYKGENGFTVELDRDWLKHDQAWKIPVDRTREVPSSDGTKITVTELYPQISNQLHTSKFKTELINKIIFSYSYIITKGFEVTVNGEKIRPNPVNLRYEEVKDTDGTAIQPYVYTAKIDDVEVKLIVGFQSGLVGEDEEEEEKHSPKNTSTNAGWTIVCNDRIVVYRDKTELTGWGVHFPRYHTQFIGISGTLYFKSTRPELLPITTTKRGIDASSALFLRAQKHIIEGTKLFIAYTNKWKGESLRKQSNERLRKSSEASPLEIIEHLSQDQTDWSKVRNRPNEKYLKPKLPTPPEYNKSTQKISFNRSSDEIDYVRGFLNRSSNSSPSQIGEACFEYVLRDAEK